MKPSPLTQECQDYSMNICNEPSRERTWLCVTACDPIADDQLRTIIAWHSSAADERAAAAARMLKDLGWKVFEPDGSEF